MTPSPRCIVRARIAILLAATLAGAGVANAQVQVRSGDDGIAVSASDATLAEVLESIARAIDAELVYEGPPPTRRVTFSVVGRTPAELMLRVLDGEGIDYALQLDAAGRSVAKLVIASTASASGARRPPPAPAPAPEAEPAPVAFPDVPSASQRTSRGPFPVATPEEDAQDPEDEAADPAEPPDAAPAPTPLRPAGPLVFPGPLALPRPETEATPPPQR